MARVKYYSINVKLHGLIATVIFVFLMWMAVTGLILANRETIREAGPDFGSHEHPLYELGFSKEAIGVSHALELGWAELGSRQKFSRVELKWERGAPIYRIRFQDARKSEVTIHAVSGVVLISPVARVEIKKIVQDLHEFAFLPESIRWWVFDSLAFLVLLSCITGLIILIKKRRLRGSAMRQVHFLATLMVGVPLAVHVVTGIALNHEDFVKREIAAPLIVPTPVAGPGTDFDFRQLALQADEAVTRFQAQFAEPVVLRRVVLKYDKEAQVLLWVVEPNGGMRNPTKIDAMTGDMIKPDSEMELVEFLDQLHEWFLFGDASKYVVAVVVLLTMISLITGLMLAPKTPYIRSLIRRLPGRVPAPKARPAAAGQVSGATLSPTEGSCTQP